MIGRLFNALFSSLSFLLYKNVREFALSWRETKWFTRVNVKWTGYTAQSEGTRTIEEELGRESGDIRSWHSKNQEIDSTISTTLSCTKMRRSQAGEQIGCMKWGVSCIELGCSDAMEALMGSSLQGSVKPERGLCLSINLSFLRHTIMKNLRVITDVRKSVSLDEDNPRIISEILGLKSISTLTTNSRKVGVVESSSYSFRRVRHEKNIRNNVDQPGSSRPNSQGY